MASEMQYKCFMEVANRLSFTRAASNLFITQQACSKYISSLETELQFPLFERSTRKVVLTEDGKRLYSALLRFKTEYDTIIKMSQQHYSAREMDINFGLMKGTSPSILVEGIRHVKEIFPGIKLNWHYCEQHELSTKILSNELDLAIVFKEGAEIHPQLNWSSIFRFHSYLLIASHIVGDSDSIPYEILEELPFAAHIQFGLTDEESINEAKTFLGLFKLPYKDIILYESVDDSLAGVETGESFTVTPPIFQHAFYTPFLKKYPLERISEIGCIWNPKNSNRMIERVVATLTESSQIPELNKLNNNDTKLVR